MADGTKIEWSQHPVSGKGATWQPVTGCSIDTPGCINCYAMRLAGTRLRNHPSRAGLTRATKNGPAWTGEVRFNKEWLTQPLHWRDPRGVFVCAHGDLFHENVPDEWIDQVMAVMALCPQHIFYVLTKRSARMRDYFSRWFERIATSELTLEHPSGTRRLGDFFDWHMMPAVLPNVWLGVSAEDQRRYDDRKEHLRATPAAVHFFSFEPLLGPIVGDYFGEWVIVGGESGKNARPMHPKWARDLRDQCAAAGVPFFFKQWGAYTHETRPGTEVVLPHLAPTERAMWGDGRINHIIAKRVGKKAAGRLLDGHEHSEWPA